MKNNSTILIAFIIIVIVRFSIANSIGQSWKVRKFKKDSSSINYICIDIESIALYEWQGREDRRYIYINPNIDFIKGGRLVIEPNIGADVQGGFAGFHLSTGPSFVLLRNRCVGLNIHAFFSIMMLVKAGLHFQVIHNDTSQYKPMLSIEFSIGIHLPWNVIWNILTDLRH